MPYQARGESVLAMLPANYRVLATSFRRSLMAENKAEKTITTYMAAVERLGAFLVARGMPTAPADVRREHVEEYILSVLEASKPATASNRYRALQQFFKWLLIEGEIESNPMVKMKAPILPEEPPQVLTEAELQRLFQVCGTRDYLGRRDTAILALLVDTGMRRTELANLRLEDVDLDANTAYVLGKGRKGRTLPFGRRTARDIDRYLRMRIDHRDADTPMLWLGHAGPMTSNGIYQVVKTRAEQAGLEGVFPHLFRHGFAHQWLAGGGAEGDLMVLTGWRSRAMLNRYGQSAATQRAREAHKRLSPRDRMA